MRTLDVGCGSFPQGEVNCDLYMDDPSHRGTYGRVIKPEEYPNFHHCDAHYLPFKDNSFNHVICRHVIEHVDDPAQLFSELVRVSSDTILIQCPFWFGDKLAGKNKKHKHFFNATWFRKMAEKHNCFHNVYYSRWLGLPNLAHARIMFSLIQVPLELTVELRRKQVQNHGENEINWLQQ